MNSIAHQAAIAGRRASIGKARAPLPALAAESLDPERDAAAAAPGRPNAIHALPARPAQRIAPTRAQYLATNRTEGREDKVEGGSDPRPPARPGDFDRR